MRREPCWFLFETSIREPWSAQPAACLSNQVHFPMSPVGSSQFSSQKSRENIKWHHRMWWKCGVIPSITQPFTPGTPALIQEFPEPFLCQAMSSDLSENTSGFLPTRDVTLKFCRTSFHSLSAQQGTRPLHHPLELQGPAAVFLIWLREIALQVSLHMGPIIAHSLTLCLCPVCLEWLPEGIAFTRKGIASWNKVSFLSISTRFSTKT